MGKLSQGALSFARRNLGKYNRYRAGVASREARSGSARKLVDMYYVYALVSEKNNDLYVGYCNDLKKRYKDHNEGRVESTKPYRSWKLVYYEAYRNKKDATKREKQLKKNHRAKEDLKTQITNSLK